MNNVIKVNFKKQSKLRRARLMRCQQRNYFIKQLLLTVFVGILIAVQLSVVLVGAYAWFTR